MVKKFASVVTTIALAFNCFSSIPAIAAQKEPDVMPAYEYAVDCTSVLSLSGTTAKCKSEATGTAKVTSVVINQTLQRKLSSGTWQFVAHWNETDTGNTGKATNYQYNLTSGTYRLKTAVTFITDDGFENVTEYSTLNTL